VTPRPARRLERRAPRRGVRAWLVAALALGCLGAGGAMLTACDGRVEASRDSDRAEAGGVSGRPVDPELMAFLSKARAAHHKADIAEKEGNLAAAVEHVSGIVDGPLPAVTPEVSEVLSDAYARRAGLEAKLERFDDAAFDVERGLGFAPETSYFRGHLFEVLGNVEEARASALAAEGDARGGEDAASDALDAYGEAIRIQDEVIQRALAPSGQ
jgi:hypothetical protein